MLTNLIGIAISVLKYRLFGIRTPIVASIGVTSKCNLKCEYCYAEVDNLNGKDWPFEDLKKVIDRLHSLGTRVIMLQGGEPLLHTRIDDIIDYVKSKNIYCSITTNSFTFSKHIDAIKKLDQVQLSVDGDQEIMDNYRGQGAYDQAILAAKMCDENNIPFHLHSVVTNEATVENTLVPLTELADKYNTYLNFCIPGPTGAAEGKHLGENDKIIKMYKEIRKRKEEGMPTNNSYGAIDGIIQWCQSFPYSSYIPSGDTVKKMEFPKCVMGDLVCWLDSSGMLHPCAVQYGQEGFAYSIKEHGLEGAWSKLQELPCHFCSCSSEFNSLFSFKLESVANGLKFVGKRNGRTTLANN
jgi:MoaA/NifB/PqqE/SkfB family radical SAM enzyme